MGRQAKATWIGEHGGAAEVTLHLEAAGLHISGERRARVPRSAWSHVEAADGVVSFEADGQTYRFELGAAAPTWAQALTTPPPALAEKLGVSHGETVAVRGELPLPELDDALADASRVPPWEADVVVVVVRTDAELESLPVWFRECGIGSHVWIVHGKGRASTAPGDNAVREALRSAGWRDTKVSAVADEWSATRYSPAKAS
ncbi:hypothetical protein [Agromyces sp. Soil535]|uniref:hypothetical protein n=1 Tax=Agromyces sp. Soil535 TaxID=1736390 RepID=UPI000702006B|nr:hypothetical protein [Agromyces sp. Soil535]KRE21796.1 hypothetical protein ASG80_11920 [Agromyces sp. Soil535]